MDISSYAPFPPQNTIVFEPDDNARKDPRSLTARLYLTDVARYCPNGVGEAVVRKIEYRKSSEAPNHEFLLCYVEDRNVHTRQAVIRIERCKRDQTSPPPPPSTPISLGIMLSSSPSLFGTAGDRFTITCEINAKPSDVVLSTLTFDDNSVFTADEAAMICQIASDCTNEYNAIRHQCYWYARVIYNVIQETQSGYFKKTPPEDDKRMGTWHGTMKLVNNDASNIFISISSTPEALAKTHLEKWPRWLRDVREREGVRFPFVTCDLTVINAASQ